MADIFLSYAREQEVFVGQLAGVLAGLGWSVWWDRLARDDTGNGVLIGAWTTRSPSWSAPSSVGAKRRCTGSAARSC